MHRTYNKIKVLPLKVRFRALGCRCIRNAYLRAMLDRNFGEILCKAFNLLPASIKIGQRAWIGLF